MKGRSTMKTLTGWVVGLLALGAAAVGAFGDSTLIDVVRLKDGTVLRGLIVEQAVGESLKLATLERFVYTLADSEIERVDKQKVRDSVPFHFTDVVLLKDGVMFRGTILEQRPEHSLTMQTENEILLTFAVEDIWKILKEKRLWEVAPELQEEQGRAQREGLKISLQIELARDRLRRQEQEAGKAEGEESGGLQEEIHQLREDIQALEGQEEQLQDTAVGAHRAEEQERLRELQEEVDQALAEIADLLEQCGVAAPSPWPLLLPARLVVPEPWGWQPPTPAGPGTPGFWPQPVSQPPPDEDLAGLRLHNAVAGIVQQSIERIPTETEIAAMRAHQQACSGLVDLLGHRTWKRPVYYSPMRQLADALPAEDRVFLYETHRREGALLSAGLNLIPVLSIGSLLQGDLLGAFTGAAQFVCGATAWLEADLNGYTGTFWGLAGAAGGAYVLGILEPFSFQNRWNRRLRERLLVDEATIRQVQQERSKATALGAPGVRVLSGGEGSVVVQLDLVSLSY